MLELISELCFFYLTLFTIAACRPKADVDLIRRNITDQLQLQIIKQHIFEQITNAKTKQVPAENISSGRKIFKVKIKTVRAVLKNSPHYPLMGFIVATPNVGTGKGDDTLVNFRFGHKMFQHRTIVGATLSFYKKSQVNEVNPQILAAAEVIFGHEHVINEVRLKNTLEGWVHVNITDHISYWAQDFDNGRTETRTLKITCINCKTKWETMHTKDHLPTITIGLKQNP